jgi:hypothetical protein
MIVWFLPWGTHALRDALRRLEGVASSRVSDGIRTRDRRDHNPADGSRTPVHDKADERIRRP